MLVVFGIFLYVSHHSLAGIVEVHEGAESVQLPCQYSDDIPEVNPSVLWTRNDLNPKIIHQQREEGTDPSDQNQLYRKRTWMNPDLLDTGNFSLTLRKPHLSDSGIYTCTISDGKEELKLTQVQLEVKDSLTEVKVKEKAASVILPCKTKAVLNKETLVEWTRSEPYFGFVHVFPNTSHHYRQQDDLYCSRTQLNVDLLQTGDLSLTLKYPTDRDSGSYICTIYRDQDILRQRVVLHHVKEETFPTWALVLLIFVTLLSVAAVGAIFLYQFYLKTVHQVELEKAAESVLLPCYLFYLQKDVTVKWTNEDGITVHVHTSDPEEPNEQHKTYKERTEMNENLLKFGDHSLTIRYPSYRDRNTYTCSIINRRGKELMKKQVLLNVKVPQMVVESGAESVKLPFKTDANLPEDAKVEWRDEENRTAHVFQNGAEQPNQQSWYYRGRTEMRPNALKDKDLSLTLKCPTESDCYTCTVYSKEGKILMQGEVLLQVKAFKVVVEPEQTAVELVCKTERKLECNDIKIEWRNRRDRKVYRYPSSDQSEEQFYSYKHRTELKEGQIEKGDFSLTIYFPTDCDNDIYTCKVYRGDGTILMKKRVELHVKDHQVEVQNGCVTLPFKTKTDLLNESRIEWSLVEPTYRIVHVVDNRKSGSEQPEEQQPNRKGTKMNENLLETGDLTLTMEDIKHEDYGKYKCVIFGKQGTVLQEKTVQVLVTGVDQDQNESEPLV